MQRGREAGPLHPPTQPDLDGFPCRLCGKAGQAVHPGNAAAYRQVSALQDTVCSIHHLPKHADSPAEDPNLLLLLMLPNHHILSSRRTRSRHPPATFMNNAICLEDGGWLGPQPHNLALRSEGSPGGKVGW